MTGLSPRFTLQDGKFLLTSNADKAKDNLWFLVVFDRSRIYLNDFSTGFITLVQKPVSFVTQFQSIVLGKLSKKVDAYVPQTQIKSAYIASDNNDRKNSIVYIEHVFIPEAKKELSVIFV